MTCTPRTVSIRERMASTPVGSDRHSAVSLRAGACLMLPMWNCCQYQCCQFPIVPSYNLLHWKLELALATFSHWQHSPTPLRAHHARNDSRFRDKFPEKVVKKLYVFPVLPCPLVSCDVLPITSRTKSHRSSYLLRDMSLSAVNLAPPPPPFQPPHWGQPRGLRTSAAVFNSHIL